MSVGVHVHVSVCASRLPQALTAPSPPRIAINPLTMLRVATEGATTPAKTSPELERTSTMNRELAVRRAPPLCPCVALSLFVNAGREACGEVLGARVLILYRS